MAYGECILVVDDDILAQNVLENILSEAFEVVALGSGEECLNWLLDHRPDLILMDVKMPGLDGYATCRQLKERDSDPPPVIFVSAGEGLDDRLKGFEAGGSDYLVKPIEPRLLLAKVKSTLHAVGHRRQLNEQIQFASSTAMTAMTSMGEMGTLLQALQRFNACRDLSCLAVAVAAALADYGLEGVVRIRTRAGEAVHSTRGVPTPMEVSAVDHVAGMGRIVEFRSRLSVSYEHVTILVNNCPMEDEGRRGRLRDHLAVLAEGAEGRTAAIHQELAVALAVTHATQALSQVDANQRASRAATSMAIQDMSQELERAYVGMELTDSQEALMANIIQRGKDRILDIVSADFELQHHLSGLIEELQQASSGPA